jgi:heat shock protein HtpX
MSLLLDWFPFAVIGLFCFDQSRWLIYSLLPIAIAGIVAGSPAGELIGRVVLGCRPATVDESQLIAVAWNSVVAAIGQSLSSSTGKRFSKVKLFVSDERIPNAFALGRNTVCVTMGLLNHASPEDMAGVLAHEAGHLHFGDAVRLAVVLTTNRLGVATYRILDFGSRVCEGFGRGVLQSGRMFASSGDIAGAFIVLMALIVVIVAGVFNLAMRVASFTFRITTNISLSAVGRHEEFRADLFALNIGFGPQLIKYLRRIEALDAAPKNIWDVLSRKHPPAAVRIERLLRDAS